MYDEILQQALDMLRHFDANGDEIYEITARLLAKGREELIAQGFTREEAIIILAHQGTFLKTG